MRLSFSESDIDPNVPRPDPAVRRAAAAHIAEQEQAVWVDPDKTNVVPVTAGAVAPEPGEETPEKKTFLGLNPAQIVGGALASSTAAILGAKLGVAGTVAGAALTSVVIAVGGAAYTRSISRTGSGLGAVAARFRLGGTTPVKAPVAEPAEAHKSWRDRFSPVHIFATAAAVFLLAAVVVTGLEALRGESFAGNGQTTVSQISREGLSNSNSRTNTDSERPADQTGTQSEAPAPEATATPSRSTTPAPTSGATSSPAPTSGATPTTRSVPTSQATSQATTGSNGGGTDSSGSGGSGNSSTAEGSGGTTTGE